MRYEEWMNPNLKKQIQYHLQEIIQRIDHFAPRDEDLEVRLSIQIGGRQYSSLYEKRSALLEVGIRESV